MNEPGGAASTFGEASAHFLDTSAVITMMRQRRVVWSGALLPFARFAKLSVGSFRTTDRSREWRRIELTLEPAAGVVYPTSRTLLIYAELSAGLKAAGTPLPVNDVWIATIAIEWKFPLLHNDKHFALVSDLSSVSI